MNASEKYVGQCKGIGHVFKLNICIMSIGSQDGSLAGLVAQQLIILLVTVLKTPLYIQCTIDSVLGRVHYCVGEGAVKQWCLPYVVYATDYILSTSARSIINHSKIRTAHALLGYLGVRPGLDLDQLWIACDRAAQYWPPLT